MLIIVWSFLIMFSINSVLIQIMKLKPIDPHIPRDIFLQVLMYKYRKNIAVFLIFLGILRIFVEAFDCFLAY